MRCAAPTRQALPQGLAAARRPVYSVPSAMAPVATEGYQHAHGALVQPDQARVPPRAPARPCGAASRQQLPPSRALPLDFATPSVGDEAPWDHCGPRPTNAASRARALARARQRPHPAQEFASKALLKSREEYDAMYKHSIEDPSSFWGDIAKTFHWRAPSALASRAPRRSGGDVESARARPSPSCAIRRTDGTRTQGVTVGPVQAGGRAQLRRAQGAHLLHLVQGAQPAERHRGADGRPRPERAAPVLPRPCRRPLAQGGRTNVAYNCLDANVDKGLGDKPALLFEGESAADPANLSGSRPRVGSKHRALRRGVTIACGWRPQATRLARSRVCPTASC